MYRVSMRRFTTRLALVIALALAGPPAATLVASLVGADLSDQAQASECTKKPKKDGTGGNKPLCPPAPPPGG
jgi:orotate phosphoribosyltransferase-like protein